MRNIISRSVDGTSGLALMKIAKMMCRGGCHSSLFEEEKLNCFRQRWRKAKAHSRSNYETFCSLKQYVNHLLHMINTHFVNAGGKDMETFASATSKIGGLYFGLGPELEALEMCLSEFTPHRFTLYSPKYFPHVQLLIFFWISFLPFCPVDENGPLSFMFFVPIV